MSAISSDHLDFDFWEFVNCARCQLPFLSGPDAVATVPFWLTECGHVLCNNHLKADQSCSQCGATGVQLVPLQREMEAPMSEWFRSIPYMLDSIAYATKFQQESMAAQIRSLKARHHQQRLLIDKLKRENAELKRMNEMLQLQPQSVDPYQQSYGYEGQSLAHKNMNRKRPRVESMGSPATSSPRRLPTPVGASRLTLPPGQKPPQLSSKTHDSADDPASRRPGSSQFAQQYAYAPSQSNHSQSSHISRQQLGSRRGKPSAEQSSHAHRTRSSQLMPPPQAPRAVFNQRSSNPPMNINQHMVTQNMNTRRNADIPSMSHRIPQQPNLYIPEVPSTSQGPSNISTSRFLPQEQFQTSRAQSHANLSGGQRVPFVPK
ncbi:hypothetical protein Moror_7999 [Moniliophthora roreri MCA 2997]|uniref:RING-type domain-containing protein n=1 Tax=Moniliophthora roreri (strain MCA 2997) TaxID=1381753 RepID=V2XLB2_MONRO|nr:hypothetical protein Moror_7999 [Moniliophthora roreri MCA 2997]KAI3610658.1 hypothetical protein WG66_006917 [Moniliophthora roreri]